jgi:hypothetical protein
MLVALGLLDVALTATVGSASRWLPYGQNPTDNLVLQVTGGKISGIASHPDPPGIGSAVPLGVLLGQSTLGAGVNTRILEDEDGLTMRWLKLDGWGGSVTKIPDISELLYLNSLRPNVVVIAINPYMLKGVDFELNNEIANSNSRNIIKKLIWTSKNNFVVTHLLRYGLHRLRVRVFRWFGLGTAVLFPPDPAPWAPPPPQRWVPQTPAQLEVSLDAKRKLGWFDPVSYSATDTGCRCLAELVRQCRAHGAKVCIILVPERSALRKRTPPEAVRCFAELNRLYFPDQPVPIYDLRDRMPDRFFVDPHHLIPEGRDRASLLWARCMREFAPEYALPPEPFAPTAGHSASVVDGSQKVRGQR